MRIYGHRGAPEHARENSIAGFRAAIALGADGVELDVQALRDGRLVVFHDAMVGERLVASFDRGELEATVGHEVSELDEVLGALPEGVEVLVELKRRGSIAELGMHRAVAATLERHPRIRPTLLSFDPWMLRAMAEVAPVLPRSFVLGSRQLCDAALLFRGLDFADGLALSHDLVPGPLLDGANERGLAVRVWTVDEDADLRRCLALPLTGIISNRPDRARALR